MSHTNAIFLPGRPARPLGPRLEDNWVRAASPRISRPRLPPCHARATGRGLGWRGAVVHAAGRPGPGATGKAPMADLPAGAAARPNPPSGRDADSRFLRRALIAGAVFALALAASRMRGSAAAGLRRRGGGHAVARGRGAAGTSAAPLAALVGSELLDQAAHSSPGARRRRRRRWKAASASTPTARPGRRARRGRAWAAVPGSISPGSLPPASRASARRRWVPALAWLSPSSAASSWRPIRGTIAAARCFAARARATWPRPRCAMPAGRSRCRRT